MGEIFTLFARLIAGRRFYELSRAEAPSGFLSLWEGTNVEYAQQYPVAPYLLVHANGF
jgi:hypothetical protein